MEDIASAAGVTKPLLYQHFDSKRALYLELIDDVATRLIDTLAAASVGEARTHQQVEAGFEAYFRFTIENHSAVRMLFDAPHDEELARGLRTIEDSIAEFLTPIFDASIEESHRRTLAAAVVGMTEGVTRDWLRMRTGRHAADVDSFHEAHVLAERLAGFAWGGFRSLRTLPEGVGSAD